LFSLLLVLFFLLLIEFCCLSVDLLCLLNGGGLRDSRLFGIEVIPRPKIFG
jgi:hypothetical protein